ncbi:MAG: hypothetical protein WBC91_00725 [Phototrophicaceae bacterium]
MSDKIRVGRILRASTRGFDCGTHSREIGPQHDFGAFVKAPISNTTSAEGQIHAVGIIYKVEIKDDQLVNELVLGESVPDMILRDQRENRMIPVEIKVINVGYQRGNMLFHSLPPRPPMSLSDVDLMLPQEVHQFTQTPNFFRLLFNASEVPTDDLIAAAIRYAALEAYPVASERYDFHVRCGQQLARDMNDLTRLSHLLNLIRP